MALIKLQLPRFPHLKLVLMSATLQEELFAKYFECPVVYISGRTHPVEIHYLPDINALISRAQRCASDVADYPVMMRRYTSTNSHLKSSSEVLQRKLPPFDPDFVCELVIRMIQTYSKETPIHTMSSKVGNAILVFLSGLQAIQRVEKALKRRNLSSLGAFCLTLHGSMPSESQRKVFRKTKPGEWKVILSTNIAETSITVDDVTHVIDCGWHKEMRFDAISNVSSLQEVMISKAAAQQRAGRAGRTQPGHAWRVYSSELYDSKFMEEYALPEIRRVPLEEVVLHILLLQIGMPDVILQSCIEPPSTSQIKRSIKTLIEIKAVLPSPDMPLTALGYHLAKLPVDVRLGKLLIMGSLLDCLDPVLTIAAALGGKSPFQSPKAKIAEASAAHKRFKEQKFSDHLAIVAAYNRWKVIQQQQGLNAAQEFCRANFLSSTVLEDIQSLRRQFKEYLQEAGFINEEKKSATDENGRLEDLEIGDENSESPSVEESSVVTSDIVRCALTAGLYPQILRARRFNDKRTTGRRGKGREDLLPIHLLQADNKEVMLQVSYFCYKIVIEHLGFDSSH